MRIDAFLSRPFCLSDRNHDMNELSPQGEKFPKLIDPSASFSAFIGNLGDVSVKAVDKPLHQAVNWGRICISYGQFTLRLCAVLESLVQHRVLVITYNALAFLKPLALSECDLILVLGTVNRKTAPRLRIVYDQTPEPKYVWKLWEPALLLEGLYFDSYYVLPGVDVIYTAS